MCSKMLVFYLAVLVAGVNSFSFGETGQECGVEASSNLIHHNPWLVFLEYIHNGHLTKTRCGGTLIDSRHVITAAHCVQKLKFDSLNSRLGEYDLNEKQECVDGVCIDRIVTIEVEAVIIHPGYDNKEHDIAILRLKKDAPYTDFIRPACLPTGEIKEDATFIAAGWGIIPRRGEYSHVKKIIPLPYFNTESCQLAFGATTLPKSVVCAGGQSGIDTCSGDSGGPLVWMKERAELWGIISSGSIHCGMEGVPAIYTKVVDYLDWIKTVVSGQSVHNK